MCVCVCVCVRVCIVDCVCTYVYVSTFGYIKLLLISTNQSEIDRSVTGSLRRHVHLSVSSYCPNLRMDQISA